jgi:CheY-like chemotaxis protein
MFFRSSPPDGKLNTSTFGGEREMKKRILVVEDDFDTRYVFSLVLKNEGYEVLTAADGECALAVVSEEKPDLVITDISLPRLNGIELIKRIKLAPETAAIPILVVTAYGRTTARKAIAAGACECADKPVAFSELIPCVKRLLA